MWLRLIIIAAALGISGCITDKVLPEDVDAAFSGRLQVDKQGAADVGVNPLATPFLKMIDVVTAGQLSRDTAKANKQLSDGSDALLTKYKALNAAIYLPSSTLNMIYSAHSESFVAKARTAIVPTGYVLKTVFPAVAESAFNEAIIVNKPNLADDVDDNGEEAAAILLEPTLNHIAHQYGINNHVYFNVEMSLKALNQEGAVIYTDTLSSGNVAGQRVSVGFKSGEHVQSLATSSVSAMLVASSDILQNMLNDPGVSGYLDSFAKQQQVTCQYWNPVDGILDPEKAYQEAKGMLNKTITDNTQNLLQQIPSASGTLADNSPVSKYLFITTPRGYWSLSLDNVQKGMGIAEKVLNGDYRSAAGDTADWVLEITVPAVAAYRQLMVATSSAVEAMVANWENDLYESEGYGAVVDIMNNELMKGYRNLDPYLPSKVIKDDDELKAKMEAREDEMFRLFESSHEVAMFKRGDWNRVVSMVGPTATSRDYFDALLGMVINQQYSHVITVYKKAVEKTLRKQAWQAREAYVTAVCEQAMSGNN